MLEVESLKATAVAGLIGTDAKAAIHRKDELTKEAGDKVTFNLRMQLTGDGRSENETLEGNEESFNLYADSLVINELRHAVRVKGRMSIHNKRVAFNLRDEAKDGLKDWWAKRLSVSVFNQLCGNTAETRPKYLGFNAVTAPSSSRIIRAGAVAADNNLAASNIMTLTLLDHAKEMAEVANPMIRPVSVDGEDMYIVYMDPRQVTDVRTNTSTGQWLDITKSAWNGRNRDNPIFTGALGIYNGMILRKAADGIIPNGVNASNAAVSNTKRAVLIGAQAAVIGFSKEGGVSSYNWQEEEFDYGDETGIATRNLFGVKKTIYNSVDYGTIVISTYAASHTGA